MKSEYYLNDIIVNVLKEWLTDANKSKSIIDWINENQMWIYPKDANYVVYGHTNLEGSDYGCEIFLSDEFIVLNFESSKVINTFLNSKVLTIQ